MNAKFQEDVFKKIINDQLEWAYRIKTWRPPGADDSDEELGVKGSKKVAGSSVRSKSIAGDSDIDVTQKASGKENKLDGDKKKKV